VTRGVLPDFFRDFGTSGTGNFTARPDDKQEARAARDIKIAAV
jgi:hypothetical protein